MGVIGSPVRDRGQSAISVTQGSAHACCLFLPAHTSRHVHVAEHVLNDGQHGDEAYAMRGSAISQWAKQEGIRIWDEGHVYESQLEGPDQASHLDFMGQDGQVDLAMTRCMLQSRVKHLHSRA